MRWASVTGSPHPLQPKASLCSLGQSSSRPSRNKCSPHPPHSRTIRPDASTQRSSPSPCQDSSDDCMSFIPSCPSFFMAALIEPAIQSIRVGHMSPWDYPLLRPRGSSHRAHPSASNPPFFAHHKLFVMALFPFLIF